MSVQQADPFRKCNFMKNRFSLNVKERYRERSDVL